MHDTRAILTNDHPMSVGFVGGAKEYRDAFAAFVKRGAVKIRDYPTGRSVLRRAQEWNAVWLIDIEVPDMNGFDLYEMIRERLQDSIVCMIGTEYCQADEVCAYRAGVTIYACRPLETAWMQRCVELLLDDRKSRGVGSATGTAGSSFNSSSAESSQIRRSNDDSIPIRFRRGGDHGRIATDNHATRIRSSNGRSIRT